MLRKERNNLQFYKGNFFKYSIYRITSLISLGPVFIIASFMLASGYLQREYLGMISILILFIELGLEPFFGFAIDKFSRKIVLKYCAIGTIATVLVVFSLAIKFGSGNEFMLLGLLVFGDIITGLVFSAQRSLQQSISSKSEIGRNNGISEITSQIPQVIGALLTIPIIIYIGFFGAILFAIATSFLAILLLSRIKEEVKKSKPAENYTNITTRGGYKATLHFMKENLAILVFVTTLNFAFVCLMSGNYLTPVYIYKLGGSAYDLAIVETIYALSAVVSGLIAPKFVKFGENLPLIWIFIGLFALGNILISVSDSLLLFMIFQPIFFGIGNPSARILRNTFVMNRIQHEISGKFFAGINIISTISRISLMAFMTLSINTIPIEFLWKINGIAVIAVIFLSIYMSIKNNEVRRFVSMEGTTAKNEKYAEDIHG
ncbi:MAG: MFS transporter [Candidatus Thermoplasmatota archaeon]|nr:MFS transporter [Candidatus Thermoplasmatota archaeon]